MVCQREYTVQHTGAGQMRNESSGTCYNINTLGFALSAASLTFLQHAAARHVFSNTTGELSTDTRMHTQRLYRLS